MKSVLHQQSLHPVMIMISLGSCTLVEFDMEGDGWKVWEPVAWLLKSLRVNGWSYVELKLRPWGCVESSDRNGNDCGWDWGVLKGWGERRVALSVTFGEFF